MPHLHFHVVPRRRKDGLTGFVWSRHGYKDQEEILRVQNGIRSAADRALRAASP